VTEDQEIDAQAWLIAQGGTRAAAARIVAEMRDDDLEEALARLGAPPGVADLVLRELDEFEHAERQW
jgi:hypothetical protein